LGAWANATPAARVTPATNRQSREPYIYHAFLKLVDVRSVPWGRDCDRIPRRVAAPLSRPEPIDHTPVEPDQTLALGVDCALEAHVPRHSNRFLK
jgi:hypothetical protein